jgi:hypothetical protein
MEEFNYAITDRLIMFAKLKNMFEDKGYKVLDRHYDQEFKDIHVLFELEKDGTKSLVHLIDDDEINRTKNFFIEDGSQRTPGLDGWEDGWLRKCEADILCYHDRKNGWVYLLEWQKMRYHVTKNYKKIRFENKEDVCPTYCYLLPIYDANQKGFILDIHDLKTGRL